MIGPWKSLALTVFYFGCATPEELDAAGAGAGTPGAAGSGGVFPGSGGSAGGSGQFLSFDVTPQLVCPLDEASVAWALSASPTSVEACVASAGKATSCSALTPATSGKISFEVGPDTAPGKYTVWGRAVVAGQSTDSAPVGVEVRDGTACAVAGAAPACASASCIQSTLADDTAISAVGLVRYGGTLRDGGWAVDATCDRLEMVLPGWWGKGTITFQAKDLHRQLPYDPSSHGCERFVFNLNNPTQQDPDHIRLGLASMAADCGAPRGNLRAFMSGGGPCCVDGPQMPAQSDGAWHEFAVSWDGSEVRVLVDGAVIASSGYGALTPGCDVHFQFGSECADGDQTHAVFRNLKVCPTP